MSEGTFYFSDTHIGAGPENFDLIDKSFSALPEFYREHYMDITKAVDLGDTVECWVPGEGHENPYLDNRVIGSARNMYGKIFNGNRVDIAAFTGNHQTHILEGAATPELASLHGDQAVVDFRNFLLKVFRDNPEADVEMIKGVEEVEEGVIAHHGDILNTQTLTKLFDSFDEGMSTQDKMAVISGSADISVAMQKVWQKFRKYLWPMIQKWPKWLPSFVDVSFPPYLLAQKTKSWIREALSFTKRPLSERWKNPMYDEAIMQFELLKHSSDNPADSAIVSGHFHAPGIVSDAEGYDGTVVSLGAWHDTNTNPVVGIRTDLDDQKLFLLAEYEPVFDKWQIRDEKVIRGLS